MPTFIVDILLPSLQLCRNCDAIKRSYGFAFGLLADMRMTRQHLTADVSGAWHDDLFACFGRIREFGTDSSRQITAERLVRW